MQSRARTGTTSTALLYETFAAEEVQLDGARSRRRERRNEGAPLSRQSGYPALADIGITELFGSETVFEMWCVAVARNCTHSQRLPTECHSPESFVPPETSSLRKAGSRPAS